MGPSDIKTLSDYIRSEIYRINSNKEDPNNWKKNIEHSSLLVVGSEHEKEVN